MSLLSTEVWVDFAHTGPESGTEQEPYNTLGEGVAALGTEGGTLNIVSGVTFETATINAAMSQVARPMVSAVDLVDRC